MLIVASLLAAGAVVLFVIGRVQASKATLISGTGKVKAAVIQADATSVAAEIGSGGFSKFVEVGGLVACDAPLEAELSGTPCVRYETKVMREYEENYVETDSKGSTRTQTRRGSEVVSQNARSCPFFIDDGSGKIEIDPTGAEFDLETTMSRFEPGEGGLTIGAYVLKAVLSGGGGRRTIGYRFEEKCLPVGRQGYVFGEATDAGGHLRMSRSGEKGKRFIISLRSEQELVRSAKRASTWLTVGSAAALAAGIAALVFRAIQG